VGEQRGHVVWFCTREEPIVYISGRPFVLRDVSEPRKTLALSDRAENLEGIEGRLKQDILVEAARFGGLVLTHNELATDTTSGTDVGAILPTWTAVDASNVKTSRELWENMKQEGWNVDYFRIPISPDRPIEVQFSFFCLFLLCLFASCLVAFFSIFIFTSTRESNLP
jgi:hypothetical protein